MEATREPRRIPLVWLLAPFVLSTVLGYIGDIMGPKLIVDHPLLQISLNSRSRWLLLATPNLDALSFFVVGFLRLISTDPIGFLLGWHYRERALAWAQKNVGDQSSLIGKVEKWFGRIGPLVLLVMPNFYLCVLAGATRMRPRLFVALNLVGTVGRLILFWVAGEAFRDELEDVLELIQRFQWPLVAVSFVFVAFTVFRAGGIESPEELAEELEAEQTVAGESAGRED